MIEGRRHRAKSGLFTGVSVIRGTLSLSYNLRFLLVDGLRDGGTEPKAGYLQV